MPRSSRVMSFMSQFGTPPRSPTTNASPTTAPPPVDISPSSSQLFSAPSSDSPQPPRTRTDRASSRPMSMVYTYHPPLMEVAQDTPLELQPIFTFLNSHSNKLYQEGYLLKLNDLDSHGKPCPDRSWGECFAQLVGTVLSLWDASALDAAGQDGEVIPHFVNLTDASIKMIETLPTRAQDVQPLQNVLSISTAGKNRYLLHFNSLHSLTQWTAGIRLAMFEHASLQELYTGSLIAGKGKTLNNIKTIMDRTRLKHEDWTRVRFGAGTPWRRCWCVITPPDEKDIQKQRKQMKKKSSYDRNPPPLKGDIKFYDTKKTKKAQPIATINDAFSAYAIYPQSKPLIDQSTLVKVEGSITIHTNPPSTTEGFIFVMPELHPAVSGFEMMLRFLFPVFDVFTLYGRPGKLIADTLDVRGLMFAMPQERRYDYLEILDVSNLIHTDGSHRWREADWRRKMKELTARRIKTFSGAGLDAARSSRGDLSNGAAARRAKRASLPPRPGISFDDQASIRSTPASRELYPAPPNDVPVYEEPTRNTATAPPAHQPFSTPRHARSVSEAQGYQAYRDHHNQNVSDVDEFSRGGGAPAPPPHRSELRPLEEMSRVNHSSDSNTSAGRSSSDSEPPPPPPHPNEPPFRINGYNNVAPDPVAAPPAFAHQPGARPSTRPYHSPELRRANSRMSTETLSQLAGAGATAGGAYGGAGVGAPGTAAAWQRTPDSSTNGSRENITMGMGHTRGWEDGGPRGVQHTAAEQRNWANHGNFEGINSNSHQQYPSGAELAGRPLPRTPRSSSPSSRHSAENTATATSSPPIYKPSPQPYNQSGQDFSSSPPVELPNTAVDQHSNYSTPRHQHQPSPLRHFEPYQQTVEPAPQSLERQVSPSQAPHPPRKSSLSSPQTPPMPSEPILGISSNARPGSSSPGRPKSSSPARPTLHTSFSVTRKPVPGRTHSSQSAQSGQSQTSGTSGSGRVETQPQVPPKGPPPGQEDDPRTSSSLSSLRNHMIDQDALDRVLSRPHQGTQLQAHTPTGLGLNRQESVASRYDDDESTEPDYASTTTGRSGPAEPERQNDRPRMGVMRTVGTAEQPPPARVPVGDTYYTPDAPKAGAVADIPDIDFGPTINYAAAGKAGGKHEKSNSGGTLGSGGGGSKDHSKSSSAELDLPKTRGAPAENQPGSNPHSRTSSRAQTPEFDSAGADQRRSMLPTPDDKRRSMAWQPGLAGSGAARRSLTPEEYVNQRAAQGRVTTPVYAHQKKSSRNASGEHLRNVSGESGTTLPRPHSRGPLPDSPGHLSAREQEHVARVTGSPLLANPHQRTSPGQAQPSGLIGAIEAREREKKEIREGLSGSMVQQAIHQRQQHAPNMYQQQQQYYDPRQQHQQQQYQNQQMQHQMYGYGQPQQYQQSQYGQYAQSQHPQQQQQQYPQQQYGQHGQYAQSQHPQQQQYAPQQYGQRPQSYVSNMPGGWSSPSWNAHQNQNQYFGS